MHHGFAKLRESTVRLLYIPLDEPSTSVPRRSHVSPKHRCSSVRNAAAWTPVQQVDRRSIFGPPAERRGRLSAGSRILTPSWIHADLFTISEVSDARERISPFRRVPIGSPLGNGAGRGTILGGRENRITPSDDPQFAPPSWLATIPGNARTYRAYTAVRSFPSRTTLSPN